MIIHKFGGASVKDAPSIKNLARIIRDNIQSNAVIIVSAMGKTTNKLETVTAEAFAENSSWKQSLQNIAENLFAENRVSAFEKIREIIKTTREALQDSIHISYDKLYDFVVSTGEILSTTIIYEYLKEQGFELQHLQAHKLIITDETHREGKVNWDATWKKISASIANDSRIYLTQGFIAGTEEGVRTTLGREGSDFTAAIFANILDAEEVRIWKDVDGIYNADPKIFPDAVLLPRVSYRECVELAYYGARVIHPRTILPLKRKNIPLYVQSFKNIKSQGTIICSHNINSVDIPCFIIKNNQCLMTISPINLGFMAENYVEKIIQILKTRGIRINLLQSSAVNLTVCFDFDEYRFIALRRDLENHFEVRYNTALELLTISNYSEECINEKISGKDVLLKQQSRRTARIVLRNKK